MYTNLNWEKNPRVNRQSSNNWLDYMLVWLNLGKVDQLAGYAKHS